MAPIWLLLDQRILVHNFETLWAIRSSELQNYLNQLEAWLDESTVASFHIKQLYLGNNLQHGFHSSKDEEPDSWQMLTRSWSLPAGLNGVVINLFIAVVLLHAFHSFPWFWDTNVEASWSGVVVKCPASIWQKFQDQLSQRSGGRMR